MNALERAQQLFASKGGDVPLIAHRYMAALAEKVGGCGEVFLTALSWYAEKEEGLTPSGDLLYDFPDDQTSQQVVVNARAWTWKPAWWNEEVHGKGNLTN